MARKPTPVTKAPIAFVDFDFENRTYQIDPTQKKVYRRFVEIETSRASEILSIWRLQLVVP